MTMDDDECTHTDLPQTKSNADKTQTSISRRVR